MWKAEHGGGPVKGTSGMSDPSEQSRRGGRAARSERGEFLSAGPMDLQADGRSAAVHRKTTTQTKHENKKMRRRTQEESAGRTCDTAGCTIVGGT